MSDPFHIIVKIKYWLVQLKKSKLTSTEMFLIFNSSPFICDVEVDSRVSQYTVTLLFDVVTGEKELAHPTRPTADCATEQSDRAATHCSQVLSY